uniref:Isotrichodermin C-15 hydroxylase n=1 Tax=Talaromyces marneffei PM1 TaxID=1077442 RepID=A0A093W1X1_TALMA
MTTIIALWQLLQPDKLGFWVNLGIILTAVFCLWSAVTAIYNIFFHPLCHFPGPIVHCISRIPWAIRHARGEQAFYTQRLHDMYGPVVRIAPNHLSFTDPRAWKDIYYHRVGAVGGMVEMAKSTEFTRNVKGQLTTIVNADQDEHQQLRRALSHGFSDSSMRQQEPTMLKHINMLVDRLRTESGKNPDMAAWYNWTTFDLSSDLIFGESFHCLQTVNYHPWVATIMKAIKFHAFMVALGYGGARPLVELIHKAGGFLAMKTMRGYIDSMLKGYLLDKLSVNATVLLLAGSETTATCLSGTTYFLLTHPEVLEKVTAEIRSAFSTDADINIQSVNKLTYLIPVLNESLRMYPPLTSGMVREVPTGGAEIAGRFVPGDTLVEIQHWSINHSKENWVDPWSFRPERFMVDVKVAKEHSDMLEAVQAFSMGPRNCIGRNHSWIERQKNYNVWDRIPLNVTLTPVEVK